MAVFKMSKTPVVKVNVPLMVKAWLPTVTPPALLIVKLPNEGAAVKVPSGMDNADACVPKVRLEDAVTVIVPLVLTIGAAAV